MKNLKYILPFISLFLLSSCNPKVYVIDQNSIMEMESAGEWPDFESKILSENSQMGPTPLAKEPLNEKNKKKLSTLVGESHKAQ